MERANSIIDIELIKLELRVPGTTAIYALYDPNEPDNVRYVGKSVGSLEEKLKNHIGDSLKPKRHVHCWIKSLLLKGITPSIKLLQRVHDDKWEYAERYWIKKMRDEGHDLTNLTDGGDGTIGYIPTEETRAKLSQSSKGRLVSQETRRKISNAQKGKIIPLESRKRMSESHKGKSIPKEQALKIGEAHRKRFDNPTERKRISEIMKRSLAEKRDRNGGVLHGQKPSEETKKRMSDAHKKRWLEGISESETAARAEASKKLRGIPRPEEVRQKISEKLKGRSLPPDAPQRRKGRKLSSETRAKLVEAHRRRREMKELEALGGS